MKEVISFRGKKVILYFFEKSGYGKKQFDRDLGNFIKKENRKIKKKLPSFDDFKKLVGKELTKLMPDVLSKEPNAVKEDPFTIEFIIRNVEDYSEHLEKRSRIDHMYIVLSGPELAKNLILPVYFFGENQDAFFHEKFDLVGIMHFQVSLPLYKYFDRFKRRALQRYGLTERSIGKIKYGSMIPLFETLSDLRVEGMANFWRRKSEGITFDVDILNKFKANLERLAKETDFEKAEEIYDGELYTDDIEILGRYMCFFIGLAVLKHMGVKSVTVNGKNASLDKLGRYITGKDKFVKLDVRICGKVYTMLMKGDKPQLHRWFIIYYTLACKELGIPENLTVITHYKYDWLKKTATRYNKKYWGEWVKKSGYVLEHRSFLEVIRERHGNII